VFTPFVLVDSMLLFAFSCAFSDGNLVASCESSDHDGHDRGDDRTQ